MYYKVGDFVNFRLHRKYKVPGLIKKIDQQFVGPFKVLKKIGRLAYRLKLLFTMSRIHPVIFLAHLEPATDPAEDPF